MVHYIWGEIGQGTLYIVLCIDYKIPKNIHFYPFMSIKQIDANIFVDNIKSIKLLEKFGFILTGTKYYMYRGMEYPHGIYIKYTNENYIKA